MKTNDEIRTAVTKHYSEIARGAQSGCCGGGTGGSEQLGYTAEERAAAPAGADLGLGCGNPQAIAELRPGETVIDLGAGGGFDAFLAARAVGSRGRVIGVDASTDMVQLARKNAGKHGTTNVEFRLGEIEAMPVADDTADVVISNCVVNLSPDKPAVYREAFRVLRAGGRIAITDVVALAPLPAEMAEDLAAVCGCIAGAAGIEELRTLLRDTGFTDVRVEVLPASREIIAGWGPGRGFEDQVASARITATKPGGACCAPECCG
jgi:SAM-dependent methyltransferase